MYGLPENFDGSFLIGKTLEMVCFNVSQLYLHFSNHIIITIESSFSYRDADSQSLARPINVPVKESNLMQLLGHLISKASGDQDGTLTLVFDNGEVFKCFDSSKNFESYQIKYGDQLIVV
jgi:hypothetical protein